MTTEYITRPDYENLFNGCVGYWDFNGDAKDCINGNEGTVTGASLTTNRFGMQNRAYSFDGTNDYIDTGLSAEVDDLFADSTSRWSVMAWFNTDTIATGNAMVIGRGGGTGSAATLGLFRSAATINTVLRGTTTSYASGLSAGTWYCAAVTWDGTNAKAYLNGVEYSVNVGTATLQTYTVKIGATASTSIFWDGQISEPMLWNRALSAGEVLALYNLTKYKPIYPYMRRTCQR